MTWGTVFAAYPDLKIIHRARRVHSNVDPIFRLRRNVPIQDGPPSDESIPTILDSEQDLITELYSEISPQFEARTSQLMATSEEENSLILPEAFTTFIETESSLAETITLPYVAAKNHNMVIALAKDEIQKIVEGYSKDPYFSRILSKLRQESNWISPKQPLFFENDDGLLYFEDWNGNHRLCYENWLSNQLMHQ